MAETTTLTIRLTKEADGKLAALAEKTRRSKTLLVAEAIDAYVAANAWQIEAIGVTVSNADAGGPFYGHEETMAYLECRGRGKHPERPKPISIP